MIGINANNVIPHGDTIAGLKYIGRRFVADCARAEQLKQRNFSGKLRDAALTVLRGVERDAPRAGDGQLA